MDLKTLVATLQKIEALDKPILKYFHLIINNLDKKSNELNFYQIASSEYLDDNLINSKNQKENLNFIFNFNQNELIISLMKILQNFICMTYLNDFRNKKQKLDLSNNNLNNANSKALAPNNPNSNINFQNENSQSNISDNPTKFYENCVTLIIVISVKFSKISQIFSAAIVENFIEHLETHTDCLIYFIFFYRSYLFCNNIKKVCKEYDLYSYLFSFYRKFYKKSHYYELGEKENTLNSKKLYFEKLNPKEEVLVHSENKRLNINSNNPNNNVIHTNNNLNIENANNSNVINKSIIPTNINNIHKFINPESNSELEYISNFTDLKSLMHNKKNLKKAKTSKNQNVILNNPNTNSAKKYTQINLNSCDTRGNVISINQQNYLNSDDYRKSNNNPAKLNSNLKIKNFNAEHLNNIQSRKTMSRSKNNSRRLFIENFLNENLEKNHETKNLSESPKEQNNILKINNNEINNNEINLNNDDVLNAQHREADINKGNIRSKILNNIPKLNFNNQDFLNTRNEINKINNNGNQSNLNQGLSSSVNSKNIEALNINNYTNKFYSGKNLNVYGKEQNKNNFKNTNIRNITNSPVMRSSSSTNNNNKKFTTYHAFKNSIINQNPLNSKSDRKTNQQSSLDFILNNNNNNNSNNQNNFTNNSIKHRSQNIPNRNAHKNESSSVKRKVPELKFPLNTYEQHYSLSRSSQRNDFIKSSGSSTTAGIQTFNLRKKMNLLNIPNKKDYLETVSGNSIANNYNSNSVKLPNSKLTSNLNQNNPLKKLKNLAQTLGESCLAADLASLINHKRDMELEKIANEKNKTLTNNNRKLSSSNANSVGSYNNLNFNQNVISVNDNKSNNKNNNINLVGIGNRIKINLNFNADKDEGKNDNMGAISFKKDLERGKNKHTASAERNEIKNLKSNFLNKNKLLNNSVIKEEEFIKDKNSIETENIRRSDIIPKEYNESNENLENEINHDLNENANQFLSKEAKKKREFEYLEKLKNSKANDSEEEYYDNLMTNNKNNYMNEKNLQIRNILNKQQRFKNSFRDEKDISNNNNNPSYGNINNRSQNNLNELSDLKKNFIFSFDNHQGNINFYENNDIDKNLYKMRELLINLLLVCIKEYTFEELSMAKLNVNLLYSFLLLPSLQSMRKKVEIKKYESLDNFLQTELDVDNLYFVVDGNIEVKENKDILGKPFLFYTLDKSITINEDNLKKFRPHFNSRDNKLSFDSIVSINFDEEKKSQFSLKSEFMVIIEILSLNSLNIENSMKQMIFNKSIFKTYENPNPEKLYLFIDGINFKDFSKISIESLRRFIDPVIVRVKNKISFILKNFDFLNETSSWELLKTQMEILISYLNSTDSRTILVHLILEFSEVLIILKRNLIEKIFSYGSFNYNSKTLRLKSRNSEIAESSTNSKLNKPLLEIFGVYLELISLLLEKSNLITCDKLLNDLFVACPDFLEIVKYMINVLFTKDIGEKNDLNARGVSSQRAQIKNKFSSFKYTLMNFVKESEVRNTKENQNSFNFVWESYRSYQIIAIKYIKFIIACLFFYKKIIYNKHLEKTEKEEKESNKYWIRSIEEFVKFLYYFSESKGGLFYEFLTHYGSYIKLNNNNTSMILNSVSLNNNAQKSSTFNNENFFNYNNFLICEKNRNLINFPLTRILLKLYSLIFDIPNKFSFIVNEITCLDFIRYHYISFIKLYNKNLDLSTKLGDMKKILENCEKNEMKKKIKKLIREVYNDDSYLQIILQLCKLHIKCLFNLAKNRNQDASKNFLQLGIVDFMTKEIDLEHEAAEKIYKFKTQKLKDEEEENTKGNNRNENKILNKNNDKYSEKNNQYKNSKREENHFNNKHNNYDKNVDDEAFKLNKDFVSFKNKEDFERKSSNINITNDSNVEKNLLDEKEKKNNELMQDSYEGSEDLSNYSDISLDLIDRYKMQNTNIKINKNLNLKNLVNSHSMSNNQELKLNNFNNNQIKDITSKISEKEQENPMQPKNLKFNLKIKTEKEEENLEEDDKWSFKIIDLDKKSEEPNIKPTLLNFNSINSGNENEVKANNKILYFDLKNPNKKATQNNNINTEKSAWLFNNSYVENDKIKIENIQSNADFYDKKLDSNEKQYKNSSEKSKSKGSYESGSDYDDLDSLDFGTFRSKNSQRQMDIEVNPGFDKSKIPIKIAKLNFNNQHNKTSINAANNYVNNENQQNKNIPSLKLKLSNNNTNYQNINEKIINDQQTKIAYKDENKDNNKLYKIEEIGNRDQENSDISSDIEDLEEVSIRGEEHNKKSHIKPLGLKINLNLGGLNVKNNQNQNKTDTNFSLKQELSNTDNANTKNNLNYKTNLDKNQNEQKDSTIKLPNKSLKLESEREKIKKDLVDGKANLKEINDKYVSPQNINYDLKTKTNLVKISSKQKIPDLDTLIKKHISSKRNLLQDDNLQGILETNDFQYNSSKNMTTLEEKQNSSNNDFTNKIQVDIENLLKKRYNLFYKRSKIQELKEEDLSNLNLFYLKERNNRLLYNDSELQIYIIGLLMCLIITPSRGTLDELYCSSYPYEFNKSNILYLLHHHINHPNNESIIPSLMKLVSNIIPYGSGQRLLKLISTNLFNKDIYKNWEKIAFGTYGKVYQCSTGLQEPAFVAVKQMNVAESIYDPCHLFDIFTEITALETFRMENCVTQLFDYGVDSECYYIVLKRYQMSLKEWRNIQTASFTDNLPVYLNIFTEVLKAVRTIHYNNATHYDLKCDNIMIDLNVNANLSSLIEDQDFSIKIADFGECKMFLNEQDEYCIRSRGTNVFKSPEMLANYGYQVRKDADNFDRRKKLGTTRASDIWSLGCLFYELLTGKFLFPEIDDDYFGFTMKANSRPFSEIFTDEKKKELNDNTYLIDLLQFFMVCDQKYRPNIDKIIERYDHVHAILVNSNTCNNPSNLTLFNNSNIKNIIIRNNDLSSNNKFQMNSNLILQVIDSCNNPINNNLELTLEAMQELFTNNTNHNYIVDNPESLYANNFNKISINASKDSSGVNYENKNIFKGVENKKNKNILTNINNLNIDKYQNEDSRNNLINNNNTINNSIIQKKSSFKINYTPTIFKITKDIFICDYNFFEAEIENTPNKFSQLGVTHIISWKRSNNKRLTEKTEFLNLMETTADLKKPIFHHIFKVIDFLRYCMIHQGIVCFIDDFQYSNVQEKPNFLIRNLIILCFSYMMKLPAYDVWTYINSKLLFFHFPIEDLINLSHWINHQIVIEHSLVSYPSFRCLCGACVIYLKNQLNTSHYKIVSCSCSGKYDNFDNSKCPSDGCYDYIQDMKKAYRKNYEELQWAQISADDLYSGPIEDNICNNLNNSKFISYSRGLEINSILHSINVKKPNKILAHTKWSLYKCNICQTWLYGENGDNYQILYNNLYDYSKTYNQKKRLIKSSHLIDLKLSKLLN